MATLYRLADQREEAERKAWSSLAGYKFWMFGYHAAAWVKFNQVLPTPAECSGKHLGSRVARQPNPFRKLVTAARDHIKNEEL
jgi:hypothetical protein